MGEVLHRQRAWRLCVLRLAVEHLLEIECGLLEGRGVAVSEGHLVCAGRGVCVWAWRWRRRRGRGWGSSGRRSC